MVPYRFVAYINGIKFDPAAVTYSAEAGQHATFSLEVPAVPEWDILPERSHCVVFYADPVTNSWRLLVEGEFFAYNRGRSATGRRYRSLLFRTTHAVWETISYAGMVGLTSSKNGNGIDQAQLLRSEGREIRASSPDAGGKPSDHDLARTDIVAFMKAYSPNNSTLFSTFLPNFCRGIMQQTPVDAFYNVARKLDKKMWAFEDKEIASVLDSELMLALFRDSWVPQNLGCNTKLESIIRAIENLGMYTHLPIPSPPIYAMPGVHGSRGDSNPVAFVIPETLFAPHLYTVIPPACNVVFRDQITNIDTSRNYLAEPTRVITQLQAPEEFGGDLPWFFMSNDAARSADITASTADDSSDTRGASAGTVAIHDLLSAEEYTRGVQPVIVNFPMQKLVPLDASATQADKDAAKRRFSLYIESACRHYYEVERGTMRVCTVSCVFLPYIVPGFPCLVEDAVGSFWGVVQSVNHSLSAAGQPSTTLTVSHMREAYIIDGKLRNAVNPSWLNAKFLPQNINSTYAKLFGNNAVNAGTIAGFVGLTQHASMVGDDVITSAGKKLGANRLNSPDQVNMDELAATVIPIPRYTSDFHFVQGQHPITVADRVRSSGNPQLAALQFQFRAGTSISQFAKFHNLPVAAPENTTSGNLSTNLDYLFSDTPLPLDLAAEEKQGNVLFGTPAHMTFVGKKGQSDANNPYGIYTVDAVNGNNITSTRQNAARLIQASIARGITAG